MAWITTFTGRNFNYKDPCIESISIEDIAEGLSKECRFNGQISGFYSVAEHSVLMSHIVPKEYQLEALLHDAVEAYCKDIPSPLKALLPDYRRIEQRIDAVIRKLFKLQETQSDVVKQADLALLAAEKQQLKIDDKDWPMLEGIKPARVNIESHHHIYAKWLFITRFCQLINRLPDPKEWLVQTRRLANE